MAKHYRIRAGFSFAMGDGTVKTGGDIIEIDADTAANHAHKLEDVVLDAKDVSPSASKTGKKDVSTAKKTDDPASQSEEQSGVSDPVLSGETSGADSKNPDVPGAQQ